MKKRYLVLLCACWAVLCSFAQQAIVPAGQNISGTNGSASVSIGQIHFITLPTVQSGVQQWYNLLYKITATGTNGTISGAGEYAANASATLSASPSTCYQFVRWSDGNTSNPRSLTVTQDSTLTAIFEKVQFTITTTPDDVSHGTTDATAQP